jgi:hypothetical protein
VRVAARWIVAGAALGLAGACVAEYTVPESSTAASGGECERAEVACDGACVALESDPAHCGACDQACRDDDVCDAGECRSSCSDGREACERACLDLEEDPRHCGTCDRACDGAERCIDGECEQPSTTA